MDEEAFYHEGARTLQDRFDSRRLADRLLEVTVHDRLFESERAFVERCPLFFLATADGAGQPDCSYKGGMPGFVRVLDERTLAFPDYDGNGMFRSLGNVLVNPRVALLFIDFEHADRLRIHGRASIRREEGALADAPGAQLTVTIAIERVFPNCPRYIHRMRIEEYSVYAPRPAHEPPVPAWKEMDEFRPVLPGTPETGGGD